MKIKIFRAFPDSYRQSMTIYADHIVQSVHPKLGSAGLIEDFLPKPLFLTPRPMRYFSQYGVYPLQAARHQGDVNHIIDHAYSHLVHSLDPTRTIVTFHDAIWLKYPKGASAIRRKDSLRMVQEFNLSGLAKAAAVICDSESSRTELLRYVQYPAENISVIGLGVDPVFFESQGNVSKKEAGLESGFHVLHVGHNEFYKNIEGLFQAFALISKQIKDAKLVKVGATFSQSQMELAKKLGIHERIVSLGHLSKSQLVKIYQACDVLLYPSHDEGFGLPLLEAMASKLPVIASNRGSLPEILAGAGTLVEPTDYAKMAETVSRIAQDPAFKEKFKNAGREQAKKFNWDMTALKLIEVYRRVYEQRSK